ncbi:hypothetical protein DsansV1_C05g0054301 [Dioscorea sansibarensis]
MFLISPKQAFVLSSSSVLHTFVVSCLSTILMVGRAYEFELHAGSATKFPRDNSFMKDGSTNHEVHQGKVVAPR